MTSASKPLQKGFKFSSTAKYDKMYFIHQDVAGYM